MNEKDVITAAMKSCGWTQKELAKQAGYKTQSAISNRINGKSLRVDTFVKLLGSMGYEVIVASTSPNTNKNRWVVTNQEVDLDTLLSTDEDAPAVEEHPKSNGKIKLK